MEVFLKIFSLRPDIVGTFYKNYPITLLQSLARNNSLASQQRQRDNVIEPQGPETIRKISRSRCLDGVTTTNIDICNVIANNFVT